MSGLLEHKREDVVAGGGELPGRDRLGHYSLRCRGAGNGTRIPEKNKKKRSAARLASRTALAKPLPERDLRLVDKLVNEPLRVTGVGKSRLRGPRHLARQVELDQNFQVANRIAQVPLDGPPRPSFAVLDVDGFKERGSGAEVGGERHIQRGLADIAIGPSSKCLVVDRTRLNLGGVDVVERGSRVGRLRLPRGAESDQRAEDSQDELLEVATVHSGLLAESG